MVSIKLDRHAFVSSVTTNMKAEVEERYCATCAKADEVYQMLLTRLQRTKTSAFGSFSNSCTQICYPHTHIYTHTHTHTSCAEDAGVSFLNIHPLPLR